MTSTSIAARPDNKALLLFDGDCPLCRSSVRLLKRLDWLGVLQYQDARSSAPLPESGVPLVRERLLEEMHLVTPDRRAVYHGFGAFRWLSWRLPLLVAFAPLLYLPGVPKLGQRLYVWLARNRFNLVPCRDGACAVPQKGN